MGGALPAADRDSESPSSSGGSSSSSATLHAVAGALSGMVARFVIGPLDVVKIRQVAAVEVPWAPPPSLELLSRTSSRRFQVQLEPVGRIGSQQGKYTGMVQCVQTIVKEEGIGGLWRGTIPGQLLTVPYCAIQFATLQYLRNTAQQLGIMDPEHAPLVSFVSGAAAGVAATVGSYPFDLLRTTLAAQGEPRVYRGMLDAAQGIFRQDGIRGLYRGLGTTIMEIMPYSALQFSSYDLFNRAATSLRRFAAEAQGAEFEEGPPRLQQARCKWERPAFCPPRSILACTTHPPAVRLWVHGGTDLEAGNAPAGYDQEAVSGRRARKEPQVRPGVGQPREDEGRLLLLMPLAPCLAPLDQKVPPIDGPL